MPPRHKTPHLAAILANGNLRRQGKITLSGCSVRCRQRTSEITVRWRQRMLQLCACFRRFTNQRTTQLPVVLDTFDGQRTRNTARTSCLRLHPLSALSN